MYRRFRAPDYIVYGLLAIGILSTFIRNPAPFIIPLLVFGVIFLLYKFPPNRFRRNTGRKTGRGAEARRSDRERRKTTFRVIYGSKPNSDDDPPQYH